MTYIGNLPVVVRAGHPVGAYNNYTSRLTVLSNRPGLGQCFGGVSFGVCDARVCVRMTRVMRARWHTLAAVSSGNFVIKSLCQGDAPIVTKSL